MKLFSDPYLVNAYSEGDENALCKLMDRHKRKIYSFIYSKVSDHDLSNDIFQDTFMKVIVTIKAKKYNEENKFMPWVMRIAYNLCVDYFRAKKKMPSIGESFFDKEYSIFDFIVSPELNVENQLIRNQIDGDVVKLLNYLPKDQREVLELRFFKDLSFKEIAELTNVSINTSLGRMRYGILNLRKLIEQHNISLTL